MDTARQQGPRYADRRAGENAGQFYFHNNFGKCRPMTNASGANG